MYIIYIYIRTHRVARLLVLALPLLCGFSFVASLALARSGSGHRVLQSVRECYTPHHHRQITATAYIKIKQKRNQPNAALVHATTTMCVCVCVCVFLISDIFRIDFDPAVGKRRRPVQCSKHICWQRRHPQQPQPKESPQPKLQLKHRPFRAEGARSANPVGFTINRTLISVQSAKNASGLQALCHGIAICIKASPKDFAARSKGFRSTDTAEVEPEDPAV